MSKQITKKTHADVDADSRTRLPATPAKAINAKGLNPARDCIEYATSDGEAKGEQAKAHEASRLEYWFACVMRHIVLLSPNMRLSPEAVNG